MSNPQNHKYILFALRRIIRSIARVLLAAGIRFDEFAALAQSVYAESAIRDFDHPGVPSRERIAALTGLTTKQVDYFVDGEGATNTEKPTLRTLLTEVLHTWHTTAGYAGPYGIPLELEFGCPAGRCFRSLVAMVDPEIDPAIVLDELIRTGTVARAGEKRLRAISRSLLLSDVMSPQLIEHYGERMSRLAATLEYNMDSRNSIKRFERRLIADRGIPVNDLPSFENYLRVQAVDFLSDLDNWLSSQAIESEASEDRLDTGVNVFLAVSTPPVTEEPLGSLVAQPEGSPEQ